MNHSNKGLLALYPAILILGGTGLFSKLINLSAFDITAFRAVVAASVLGLLIVLTGKRFRLKNPKDLLIALGLGVLLGAHWITFFAAMQVSTIAIGMTALFSYPVMTVFVEAFVSGKRIERADVLCSLVVFAGVAIMSQVSEASGNALEGVLLGVFSALLFAVRNVLQRHAFSHYPAQVSIFYQVLAVAALLLAFTDAPIMALSNESIWKLLVLGSVFTALPHTLLATSLAYLSAKTVGFIGALQPVLGAVFAIWILSEWPPFSTIVGAALVVGGAMYESLKTHKNKDR